MISLCGQNRFNYLTITSQVAVLPLKVLAVIVAVPVAFAVTRPSEVFTVAMFVSLLEYLIL